MDGRKIESLWAHVHGLGVLQSAGSFTAAARRLGLSKAAMSQRIAELERAAGVPLVHRTTRSVRLTEAGERLVEGTRGAFAQIEQGFAGVQDSVGEPHGVLRVSAPVALGRQQIVPRLAGFLRAHPQVRVELELSDRLVAMAQEGFDIALRHAAAPPDTLRCVAALRHAQLALVASAAPYLRRAGVPETPGDLARHDCLHYLRPGDTPTWTFERQDASPAGSRNRGGIAARRGRVRVPVRGVFAAATAARPCAKRRSRDLGIALLPDFSAQAALQSGKLQLVLAPWKPVGAFGEHLYAIRPYSPVVPRAVQAFIAYWRDALAGGIGDENESGRSARRP